MADLHIDIGDGIMSCNACGAYTTDGNQEHISHYPIIREIQQKGG